MILVYLENNGQNFPKSAAITVAAALQAKAAHAHDRVVAVLIGGDGVEQAAAEAAHYGVDEVVYVKDAALEKYLAVP